MGKEEKKKKKPKKKTKSEENQDDKKKVEQTQFDGEASVKNKSCFGTATQQIKGNVLKSNEFKGPNIVLLKERIRSEGVPVITANMDRFNETELKTIEEYLIKRNGLRSGDTVESNITRYRVGSIIEEGRFCDVYSAEEEKENDEGNGKIYALKVDKRKHECKTRQRIEIGVFDKIKSSMKGDHYPECIDNGISRGKPFIIMNVLGPNLSKVREKCIHRKSNYDRRSAYYLALETLKLVRDYHKMGFIHRDIKPYNFCIGPTKESALKIYLIDFASTAKISETDHSELLRMEKIYPLNDQNLVFCSPEAHRSENQNRRTDIISWFFMIVDIFDRDILCWKRWEDSEKINEAKIAFLKDRGTMLSPLPKKIYDISLMIDDDEPKYDSIMKILLEEKKELELKNPGKKYEWVV